MVLVTGAGFGAGAGAGAALGGGAAGAVVRTVVGGGALGTAAAEPPLPPPDSWMRLTTTMRLIVTCGAGAGAGAACWGTATVAGSVVPLEDEPSQPTTAIAPQSRTNSITLARMDANFVTGYFLNIATAFP